MDLDLDNIRLAMDRIVAGIGELRQIVIDQARRRAMDDLTAGQLATVADKFENAVLLLNAHERKLSGTDED